MGKYAWEKKKEKKKLLTAKPIQMSSFPFKPKWKILSIRIFDWLIKKEVK